jgi:hypothetical protein
MDRFPSAKRYVEDLPSGVESFPTLLVHTEALGNVRDIVPGPYDDLPGRLGAYFRREIDDAWVPEALGQTTTLMLADTVGEEGLVARSHDLAERLYSGPILKRLMRLLSPTLLLMGVERRWAVMRKGTTMTSTRVVRDGTRSTTNIVVSSPEPVFTYQFARALEPFLELAVKSARGADPSVEIIEATPTCMRYEGRWHT